MRMKRCTERWASAAMGAMFFAGPVVAQHPGTTKLQTVQSVERSFAMSPADARPMVRWWWFGVAVTRPEILRELQQMKADGIGGAELAFVYAEMIDDPAHGIENLPFLS